MRAFLVVALDPAIEIGLQFADRSVDLLSEGDAIELIERGLMDPADKLIPVQNGYKDLGGP
jgi:hypothetical protein